MALYSALANTVLVAHVSYVLFVVAGLVLILAGGMRRWQWVRNLLFFDAPPWVFTVCYSAFGALVLACRLRFPPHSPFITNNPK